MLAKTHLSVKQKPIYGNTKVYDPDGNLLFLCINKKATWYLDRNLATIINKEPLEIQLNFQPKGFGHQGDNYALSEKMNKCVVCGRENDLTRHHIVPYTYRKHFPEQIKSHNSHDVVPICSKCHAEYEEEHAIELKYIFAERFNAELELKTQINSDLTIVVKYAKVLLEHGCNIPYSRKKQIIQTIRQYHGPLGRLNKILLMYAYVDLSETKTETHGHIVVNRLIEDDLLQWFVETWREHFIFSMNPLYMPEHWNIKRPIERID